MGLEDRAYRQTVLWGVSKPFLLPFQNSFPFPETGGSSGLASHYCSSHSPKQLFCFHILLSRQEGFLKTFDDVANSRQPYGIDGNIGKFLGQFVEFFGVTGLQSIHHPSAKMNHHCCRRRRRLPRIAAAPTADRSPTSPISAMIRFLGLKYFIQRRSSAKMRMSSDKMGRWESAKSSNERMITSSLVLLVLWSSRSRHSYLCRSRPQNP